VGRRAGEKVHEELFNPGERPQATPAEKIMMAARPAVDPAWVDAAFSRIEELAYGAEAGEIAEAVKALAAERDLLGRAEMLAGEDAGSPLDV
jgi:FlaA1/EpsC-like NDP-sugar epimerase